MKKFILKQIIATIIFIIAIFLTIVIVGYIRNHFWTIIPLGIANVYIGYKILMREDPERF